MVHIYILTIQGTECNRCILFKRSVQMMNQIVRRIFAGVSAVILSVSAISSDTWIGNFMQTLHADSDETILKQGSQEEFDNLEQDTKTDDSGNKIYNTNYGLHTDKTVSKAYSDGRTFDLDLESWYIGEKPVDVGLVLDPPVL